MKNTTRANFTLFKKECRKYIQLFGLVNWEILYKHEELNWSRAECEFNVGAKLATLSLATNFDDVEDLDEEICKCAYHECLELLLAPLCEIASSRDFNYDIWVRENHSVIRTLENVYFHGGNRE